NLYYQDLQDFITWGAPHTNIGDYHGWGTEMTLSVALDNRGRFWCNLAYSDSTFENNVNFDTVTNAGDAHRVSDPNKDMIGSPKLTIASGFDLELNENTLFSTQLRYFTLQPAEVTDDGGTTFSFEQVNNQFYLDASVLFKGLLGEGHDLRLSGKNLFDNRDAVAGPTLSGQYAPRGVSLAIAVYFEF
ncbi:MAG: TonB-dependent receptor, partial [Psychrosphaera sp.]|nr:TonB-dependent receptor [Psychrosphaera sp.]